MQKRRSKRSDPASPRFELGHWPFYHMNLAVRAYEAEMKRLLRATGIDVAKWRILMLAREREPISVSELAQLAIMEMSTTTRAIQRLAQDGLLKVSTRANDQRVSEVRLTPRGQAMAERVMEAAGRAYAQAFGGFSAEEVATLNALLRRAHTALREPV
jgi:MarR family transcriptional regulator, organic hydroperoxide resistance regulator